MMRLGKAATVVLVAATLLFAPSVDGVAGSTGNGQAAVVQALDRYADGKYDEAVADLTKEGGLRRAVDDLRREADAWIARVPIEDRPRATAVTAALVLELVARGLRGSRGDYEATQPLVEWMCVRWRALPPSHAERLFHLGMIALLQGAQDDHLQVGGRVAGREAAPHVRHAADRFPNESRFKLAWLTARQETRIISAHPVMPGYLQMGTAYLHSTTFDPRNTAPLDDTLRDLGLLVGDSGVGMEATLRRGVLRFAMGQVTQALPDLEAATAAPDPFVGYLAHLMTGLTLERLDRLGEGPAHYAAAVRLVPATSATIAWASSLARLGQSQAARDVITNWTGADRPVDPWVLYGLGDYRVFPQFLDALRQAIAR